MATADMAVLDGWMPPNKIHYEQILFIWQLFPIVSFSGMPPSLAFFSYLRLTD
jgi:hypothetical protein